MSKSKNKRDLFSNWTAEQFRAMERKETELGKQYGPKAALHFTNAANWRALAEAKERA
jgi:hypothetical protein